MGLNSHTDDMYVQMILMFICSMYVYVQCIPVYTENLKVDNFFFSMVFEVVKLSKCMLKTQ